MSGHNKWSKVKHKKAATDAVKSKEFSKFARLITLESKKASGNTESPGLRAIIERARGINMPNTNIERAVAKGTDKDSATLEEVIYEAYGPGGTALLIHGLTDNKNRTTAEVKHILSESGASFGEQGSASWAFEKNEGGWTAKITVPLENEEGAKLDILVEKLKEHDDVQAVYINAA